MALDQIDIDDYEYDENTKELKRKDADEMSFLDHLEILRWHIIKSLAAVMAAGIVLFLFPKVVFKNLMFAPRSGDFITYRVLCKASEMFGLGSSMCITPPPFKIQGVGFAEAFIIHIKVSMILGFIIAFPYVFWQMWSFIRPGLEVAEQKMTRGVVFVCSFLFMLGVLFGFFVISPFAISFLAGYTIEGVENIPTFESYVGFMVMFVLPAGMIFELPIVVYFLSKIGLLTPDFMRTYRRHAFISILLLAAMITPPDIVTQFLIGVPLYVLYELSIFISARVEKQHIKEYGE